MSIQGTVKALARFHTHDIRDTSFSSNGRMTLNFGGDYATVNALLGAQISSAKSLSALYHQNRPFEVLQRFQKGCKRGLILLAEPATAQRHATGEFADAPQLRLASLRGQASQGHNHAALLLGNLGEAIAVLPLVASQEGQIDLLIQIANMGRREADPGGRAA
jgi:hypothetical protein